MLVKGEEKVVSPQPHHLQNYFYKENLKKENSTKYKLWDDSGKLIIFWGYGGAVHKWDFQFFPDFYPSFPHFNIALILWVINFSSIFPQYSKASRYTASSCTDLDNARFCIGSKKIWDARIYVVKTLSSTVFWWSCLCLIK